MDVLILGRQDVVALLPMRECIDLMQHVLVALARGEVVQPLRSIVWLPDRRGALGLMPGALSQPDAMGVKVVSVFPGNSGTKYESHQGAVLLFDTQHGCLQAVVDAGEITAIRTAAVSGLATRVLARRDAGDLALLGSGTQARTHLDAMRSVRELRRVRVWSRSSDSAQRFAHSESRRTGMDIEAVASARDAVAGADLICTTTAAREPILEGAWIASGAHVNAVGACFPAARELDTAAVQRARVFVDCRESALHEAGDLLIPMREAALDASHVAGELGEVLTDRVVGRTDANDVTVFESLGIAIEDVTAVHHVVRKARASKTGTRVEIGGLRETD
jgi:ornithine cyclodeaminase